MRALDLVTLRTSRNFAIAKTVTIGICTVIVGYGGFLFFAHSPIFHGATIEAQRQQTLQGKMTVMSGDGAICYRTLFDNHTSQIVRIEKGPCRELGTHQVENFPDSDGPLGSIRKALNAK
jgi:hypothetical protein